MSANMVSRVATRVRFFDIQFQKLGDFRYSISEISLIFDIRAVSVFQIIMVENQL